MQFELHITCTKDIEKLSIDFADGTTVVKEKPPEPTKPKEPKPKREKLTEKILDEPEKSSAPVRRDTMLDVDAEFGGISQDVVQKPEIVQKDRPIKVADELQNFDF